MFMPGANGAFNRDCSEQTAREVDEEVKRLLDDVYAEAVDILRAHRGHLERVTAELLKRETLDAQAFNQILAAETARAEPRVEEHEREPVPA